MRRSRTLQTCAACGGATANPKYCSNHCQREHYWQLAQRQIALTGVVPAGASGHTRLARRYLLQEHGYKCALCELAEWQGQPMPLVLDHVNGDSQDWHVCNLRLICGNCDMLLPTYKNRNRGKGRAWRRDRYNKGLSY